VLVQVYYIGSDGAPLPIQTAAIDGRLERFGLHVDPSDCEYFKVNVRWETFEMMSPGAERSGERGPGYLYTCRVVSGADLRSYQQRARAKDLVFKRVEDACPSLFQPRGLLSDQNGQLWSRLYMNTDIRLWINNGWVKFVDPIRGGDPVVIGRESDWVRAPQSLYCGREKGLAFATEGKAN
jgi:hypothetical protein